MSNVNWHRAMATAAAKVSAYLNCGKPELAQEWADEVRRLLAEAGL